MNEEENKFINLKKGKSGSVPFVNDSSIKILGKGVVNLGSEKVKVGNVLLVEDLKHNILSVRKTCDQGYTLTFNSWKFKIREEDSRRLATATTRSPNNIYTLDRVNKNKIKSTQKRIKDNKKKI